MILSDRRKKERLPPVGLVAILLLSLAFLGLPIFRTLQSDWFRTGMKTREMPFCSAEYREGPFFRDGAYLFDNGHTQSPERARTGRYSCRLLPGQEMQFGIGVRLENLQPGSLYEASVWRFSSPRDRSYLAARSQGGKDPFYLTQPFAGDRDEKGWEQLRLQFFIPFRGLPAFTQVYVFSNGRDTVYFDDFEVRLLKSYRESEFELPVLDLYLDKPSLEKLEKKRAQAMQAGLLETGPDDWVKGKMKWKGGRDPAPVRVRLKGDWLDHLTEGKWSFRVALTGDAFWNGMQTFSLQHPGTRFFLHEWLLHECWKQEGVVTTAYDFAELRLNGESLGLYAVEEHFEKYLVERQGRREGPILKLDESGFWDGLKQQIGLTGSVSPDIRLASSNMSNAAIEPFDPDKTAENPELSAMSRRASSLIEQFRLGLRPASELFDTDRMAKFYAIADVMDAHHSTAWHNLRFFYNPITDRLEPVGFDGYGTGPSNRPAFMIQGYTGPDSRKPAEFQDLLFRDTAFVASYLGYLNLYSSPDFLSAFFESVSAARLPRELALLREYPQYSFQEQEFSRSVQYKRAMLLPQENYSWMANREAETGTWRLRNLHYFPLQLLGYALKKNGSWTPLPAPIWYPAAPDRPLLMETARDSSGKWTDLENFQGKSGALPAGNGWAEPGRAQLPRDAAWLVYRLPGCERIFRQELKSYPSFPPLTPRQELFDGPLPRSDAKWIVQGRSIRFLKGRHTMAEMVVIPEGYSLEAGPGTTLDFISGAGLLSASPIHFSGRPEQPVLITSSDGSGNGFTVLATNTTSSLEYVVFERLRALQWKDWTQTGAVTFSGADVRLEDCIFRFTNSEDALNLVQCKVDMDRCLFLDAPSDGFDCDFCTGEIRGSSFKKCANDGLDLSGSRLRLKSSRFEDCGEKGISVGERSDLACFDIRISRSPTGLAVKDHSVAIADNIDLSDCDTGFAIFQKKPEYGPARLVVRNHKSTDVERLFSVQKGSTLQLGERLIRGED